MQKLMVLMLSTLGGWVGWWLGDHFGMMTAFIISTFGGAFGWYVGLRINQHYF